MTHYTLDRMPKTLQPHLQFVTTPSEPLPGEPLSTNRIYCGDARALLPDIMPNSIALSVWSPPYFVGKSYEASWTFDDWQSLLRDVIDAHWRIINPGGFLAINIADILCFRDPDMPRISAETHTSRRSPVTREDVLAAMDAHPGKNRHQIARILGCSEQTVDRRLNGNNVRGGKYEPQTRVKIVGGLVEQWATEAGFFPYDRRIWVKDPCWANSRWASVSYRAVDEYEYIYLFWKPGVTKVDRARLTADEWRDWGSRGVWSFPSVQKNDAHEAMFPLELPTRLIRMLSEPGDTILDCFVGSGTTAVAAARLSRKFIGIDNDEQAVMTARDRVAFG